MKGTVYIKIVGDRYLMTSINLKILAGCIYKNLVNCYQTARHPMPIESSRQNSCCVNLGLHQQSQ